jgi:hypothetical protein
MFGTMVGGRFVQVLTLAAVAAAHAADAAGPGTGDDVLATPPAFDLAPPPDGGRLDASHVDPFEPADRTDLLLPPEPFALPAGTSARDAELAPLPFAAAPSADEAADPLAPFAADPPARHHSGVDPAAPEATTIVPAPHPAAARTALSLFAAAALLKIIRNARRWLA